jgi:hypothetical protein
MAATPDCRGPESARRISARRTHIGAAYTYRRAAPYCAGTSDYDALALRLFLDADSSAVPPLVASWLDIAFAVWPGYPGGE